MRTVFLAALCLATFGAVGWGVRAHSLRRCGEAVFLAGQAPVVKRWVESAAADRFLQPLLRQGPVGQAVEEVRRRSQFLGREILLWPLGSQAKDRFLLLAAAEPLNPQAFLGALNGVAALEPTGCEPQADERLPRLLAEGERYWAARQQEVRMAKLSFQKDKEIICHAESLLGNLRRLMAAAEERCRLKGTKGPASGGCASSLDPLSREIADIEKQKEFNLQKLRRKWPQEIWEGLACSSS